MSKPKKLGMPGAYTSNARADFLRRPLERMEQKRTEREKEIMDYDQKTRS